MPSFYIGSLLIFVSVYYVIRSSPGTDPPFPLDGFGWDKHLVLPVLALMARPTVQLAQVTAGLLSEELRKQYVIAAAVWATPGAPYVIPTLCEMSSLQ